MAAALLDARLRDLGIEARVHSAGTIPGGQPAASEAVAVMAARGLDTSGHRSRRVTPDMARAADLVIGLAREHVREVVAACSDAWPRALTLKELVRRGEQAGPRRPGVGVGEWLAALHAQRRPSDLLGSSYDDDVADPIGRPRGAHERTAVELDDLTERLAHLLAGLGTPAP